jgi:hypothetical protein
LGRRWDGVDTVLVRRGRIQDIERQVVVEVLKSQNQNTAGYGISRVIFSLLRENTHRWSDNPIFLLIFAAIKIPIEPIQ